MLDHWDVAGLKHHHNPRCSSSTSTRILRVHGPRAVCTSLRSPWSALGKEPRPPGSGKKMPASVLRRRRTRPCLDPLGWPPPPPRNGAARNPLDEKQAAFQPPAVWGIGRQTPPDERRPVRCTGTSRPPGALRVSALADQRGRAGRVPAQATVLFGGSAATNVLVSSSTKLSANAPAHAPRDVDVIVRNPTGGLSPASGSSGEGAREEGRVIRCWRMI